MVHKNGKAQEQSPGTKPRNKWNSWYLEARLRTDKLYLTRHHSRATNWTQSTDKFGLFKNIIGYKNG